MKKQKLTAKQASFYDYLKLYQIKNGMPPTLSKMCDDFRWKSKTSPSRLLKSLEDAGWIKRDGTPRGIYLL
jgi:SOS-response transcriptional repressor LexA